MRAKSLSLPLPVQQSEAGVPELVRRKVRFFQTGLAADAVKDHLHAAPGDGLAALVEKYLLY